jgi:hypothetical protein
MSTAQQRLNVAHAPKPRKSPVKSLKKKSIAESAVSDLADKLPALKKYDYSTIDNLMKRISVRYNISGDELHDMFVSKYGHTPDTWVKKIKNRLSEGIESNDDMQQVNDFVEWCIKILHIKKPYPLITYSKNSTEAQEGHHTGRHTSDGKIWIYVENRNMVDIFRTIFHELVHHRQDQLNMIGPNDSYPGSPVEAMADMLAGKYIKIYGKDHPEIFQ